MTVSKKELRDFAYVMAGILPLLFGLVLPWFWHYSYPLWPWFVAGIFLVLGISIPAWLNPLYWIWMKLAHVLGWINTRILLSLVYFVVILFIGLVMKLLRKDPLARELGTGEKSYRVKAKRSSARDLEKPY